MSCEPRSPLMNWAIGILVAGLTVITLAVAFGDESHVYTQRSGERAFVGGRTHAGEAVDCDLPGTMHLKNIGSKVDGAGMCVMSAIQMAAEFQGLDQYKGLRDWCANEPGGGTPPKVVKQLEAYCRAKNLPPPRYLQYEGRDVNSILQAALRSGRMACVTYGYGERYPGKIAHMVNCVKYGGQWAAILDNNFPGEAAYEWMEPTEAARRVVAYGGTGWVFVWLDPPPPASPRN